MCLMTRLLWIYGYAKISSSGLSITGVKQTLTAILKDSICFFHTSLFFRLPSVVALYWHWAQKYLTFLWAALMWVFRSSIVVCFCSQLLQMNCFYMSLQTSLAWGFIFTLITGIFDFLMDWFNVCLQMTLLWKFLVTQIADYKDVSFSHE